MTDPHNAADGAAYLQQLQSYKLHIKQLGFADKLPDRRIEHQFECLHDWSVFHSEAYVIDWFQTQRKQSTMQVDEIDLNQLRDWQIDSKTGNVSHPSGEFFTIHGLRISNSSKREVDGGWDQPILTQVGHDGGILGLLSQRFDNIPHYLVEAKAEPGNYQKLQLSPTLQATFSNLKRAHAGRKPHFAEYFEEPEQNTAQVLYRQWLSEDGGRLYLKRNLGMLVEIEANRKLLLPEGFIWLSMFQIKSLLLQDAWIGPHIRGIIAHL